MSAAAEPFEKRIVIRTGHAGDAWAVAELIGEFGGDADRYGQEVYERRLAEPGSLVLVAFADGEPVGFKAGYDRYRDGSWYSWMGGVVEPWRGRGIAQLLLEAQERWVRESGYRVLYVKTRNRHKKMIAFLATNDYDILRVEEKSALAESRILFCKRLVTTADPDLRR
jgi:GNAT superfamily N-acetyltransferase